MGRTAERPYDAARLELFQTLLQDLNVWPAIDRTDDALAGPRFTNISFFDAYFSNYIEGTEFEVEEALGIVLENPNTASEATRCARRIGNFPGCRKSGREVVRSPCSLNVDGFLHLLRTWHSTILGGPTRQASRAEIQGGSEPEPEITRFVEPRQGGRNPRPRLRNGEVDPNSLRSSHRLI